MGNEFELCLNNLPPGVSQVKLLQVLDNAGSVSGVYIVRDRDGLPTGTAVAAFTTDISVDELLEKVRQIQIDGMAMGATVFSRQKSDEKERDAIEKALDDLPESELRELLRKIRTYMLHNGTQAKAMLEDNPHLGMALIYAMKRCKPTAFRGGRIPDDFFVTTPKVENVLPQKRAHDESQVTPGPIDSTGPSPELIQMIKSMSAERLRKVAHITPGEFEAMPPQQRLYMRRIQHYVQNMHTME